jgi:hypothetical protein
MAKLEKKGEKETPKPEIEPKIEDVGSGISVTLRGEIMIIELREEWFDDFADLVNPDSRITINGKTKLGLSRKQINLLDELHKYMQKF